MQLNYFRKLPLLLLVTLLIASPASAQRADEINVELRQKREARAAILERADEYREQLESEQQKKATLSSQILILEKKQQITASQIAAKALEKDEVDIILAELADEIALLGGQIALVKQRLGALLLRIHVGDERGAFAMLLAYDTFSDFFEQVRELEELQRSVQHALREVEQAKLLVLENQDATKKERARLALVQLELEIQRAHLGEQERGTETLLANTRRSEARYQQLIAEARREHDAADAAIRDLEATLRARLAEQIPEAQQGSGQFLWPINPTKGISTYFRDPTYPYRHIFEHDAIDVPVQQGSALRAAADGVVGRAHDAGFGYSYIVILHAAGISTLYAHVSHISVNEGDPVIAGQVIGRTGGAPGTLGAGRLTTGPHLHLEFRKNGNPVDPLLYLP